MHRTPLYSSHVEMGARMVPFAGYEMPVQYTSVLDETLNTRKNAGLFDVSHMGQFSLHGPKALAALDKLVTNDLSRLSLGQAQYNILCNEKGGAIDDIIVYRRSDTHVYVCVNASNRHRDFDWIRTHLDAGVEIQDESDETVLIAVQGPLAESFLGKYGDLSVIKQLPYYWARDTKILGHTVYLSRTGYTGEDGFEIYAANPIGKNLWDTFVHEGKSQSILPVGLGARDTLRLEMGYPLYGHELLETISPLSAGLSWVVKLAKGNSFLGQEALKEETKSGAPLRLKALIISEDRRIPRPGYPILTNGKNVGSITSGTFSPHLNAPISLGFVNREVADSPDFSVKVRDAILPAKTVKLPFWSSSVR